VGEQIIAASPTTERPNLLNTLDGALCAAAECRVPAKKEEKKVQQ